MRIFLFAVLILATASTWAQSTFSPPTAGFWWNPSESGRGWNIEVQNDVVAVTHFTYRTDGSSTFLQSAGPFDFATGTVVGALNAVEQGQCIGCAYRRPTSTSQGTVRFEFSSDSSGRVIYPNGTSIQIQPFVYGYTNSATATYGTWMTNWVGVTRTVFASFIFFSGETPVNGRPAAQGVRVFPSGNRVALASEVDGTYIILIDASAEFYDLMYVGANIRDFAGVGCTYRKGGTPPAISSCTGLAYGSRVYSLNHTRRLFPSFPTLSDAATPDPKALDADALDGARALEVELATSGNDELRKAQAQLLATVKSEALLALTVKDLEVAIEQGAAAAR